MRLFWFQTISRNYFTSHRVFGCTWKIEFSGKAFHLTINIMALTQKLFFVSIFTSNHFRTQTRREREREREPATSRNQTRRRDRPAEIAPHEAYCRLTRLILLWVRSSPPLGRSRHLPLVDLSSPLGQSCRQSVFSL